MPATHPYGRASKAIDAAGLGLAVNAESLADLDLITRVVGTRMPDAEPTVELSIGHVEPPLPAAPPDLEGPYGDHWFQGSPKYFHHHWGLDVEITKRSITMGGPAEGYRRWVSVRNAMLFVLAHLYLDQGRFLVHGAAIHRRGETYLVLGESGAGKSTLAFAAARSGWDLLGDDMIVVDGAPGGFSARGVPRVPSIPGDVVGASHEGLPRLPEDDRARVELESVELYPNPARVSGVVICGHDTGPGMLEAHSGPDAMESLISSFVLSEYPEALRRWFATAAGLSRLPVVRILHCADPDDRVRRAAELLDEWQLRDRS